MNQSPHEKRTEEMSTLPPDHKNPPSLLRWMGMAGVVGWIVALPMIGGIFLGKWLDRVADQSFSWTLTLLIVGISMGCYGAWRWVEQNRKG